ncbi:flavin reductase family protein [Candidatus Lokiarchaeum ossiferum]|uniref:flavin reductase family protein n=1 Tax=Candidatus Lokiarchaeum ossiferum TaxID=2951803 RepID=UPI00352E0EA2
MSFNEIKVREIEDNTFSLISDDWALITAGSQDNYNMMTASWAGLGNLWNKKVCFTFIRPSRYTYEFTEKSDYFSVSFFTKDYRKMLNLCGTKSGRDINKMKDSGLTAVENHGTVYFKEARLVFLCKKVYYQDLIPEQFLDEHIHTHYDGNDYHRMYVGEIIACYRK